jgi:hypothetical protein
MKKRETKTLSVIVSIKPADTPKCSWLSHFIFQALLPPPLLKSMFFFLSLTLKLLGIIFHIFQCTKISSNLGLDELMMSKGLGTI